MEREKNPSSKRAPPPILERFRSRLKDKEQNGPLSTPELVRVYEEVLVELTTNSKPVITELSMIAGVHKEHADGIAMAICDRILKVPVEQKLSSLYLLDSIVKNVGHDYLRYFAARLPQVFLDTYRKLKPNSHPAMLRLFKTWPPYFPSTVLSKIEVSLQENQKTSYSRDLRHSGSLSPCLLHSAHVNPEYMEAHRQAEHSALNAQQTKPPPSLQSYMQKSFKYGEMDLAHHDLLPPCPAFERIGTAAMGGVENMLPPPRPSSPSRIRSKVDAFPERVADRSSLSGFGSGRPSDQNGALARNWFSGDVAQNAEASLAGNHDNRCDKLRARLLIDAYGSKDTSHERLPKSQRLDFNDRSSVISTKDTRSSEEEYAWESMSPTLASQNQQNIPTSFGRNTILARPDAAYLRKDFGSDRHNKDFLPWSDDPANNIANSCRTVSDKFQDDVESHKEPIQQDQSSYHAREPTASSNVFLQTSQQTSIPKSQGKLLQMPYSVSGMATIAQKKSCSFDDACQADLPFERISSRHSDSLKGEASALERHLAQKSLATSVLWPPHKSQPPLPTAASQQQIRNPSESTEPVESPMPNQPLFLHNQQFDADDRMKLNSISSQHSGFSLNLESLQQTSNLPLKFHEGQEISASLATAPVSPHLGHNSFHGQDQEAVISSNLPNLTSEITHPIHPPLQSSVYSFRPQHLPPLGPALPPVPAAAALPAAPPPLPATAAASPPAYASLPPPTVAGASVPLLPSCHPVFPPPPPPHPMLPPLPPPHPMLPPPHPVPHYHHSVPRFFNPVPSHPLFATNSHPVPILPPPVPTQNNSFTFMRAPCGPLPVRPGPLPAPSQIRPASQSTNTVISESPANAYSGLISSLMAQGLISLAPPNPPQDAAGIDFNAEFLKVRHESSINALYGDLSRQCTTCGLRFKSQEEHSNHMDWHVTKNRIAKNRKHKPSRHWYVSAKDWLSGAEALGIDALPEFFLTESVTKKKEDKEIAVPVDEDQSKCALCEEPFEYFYSDEMEEWLYRGAVYINAPNGSLECIESSKLGPIVHAKCRAGNNGSGKT